MNHEINHALKNMGLTNYEIKAYIALNSIVSGTATKISEASNLPRPKIYETLKKLEKKGLLEINDVKPLEFTVTPPHNVFEKYRKELKENMDKAEAELSMIYETQIPKVPAPIWIMHGSDKLVKKELEIISRAEKTLLILSGYMFPNEVPLLKESLEKSINKGVNTRIITTPYYMVNGEKTVIKDEFIKLKCQCKVLRTPFIKLVVRDNQEMLIAFSKFSGESVLEETAIGIWNQYPEFIETITGVYDIIWNTNLYNQLLNHSEN